MKMSFYPKLAAGNMKKNARTYVPYMLTCIITVAMYYIVKSLSQNPGVKEMIGGGYLSELMFLGSHVAALFAHRQPPDAVHVQLHQRRRRLIFHMQRADQLIQAAAGLSEGFAEFILPAGSVLPRLQRFPGVLQVAEQHLIQNHHQFRRIRLGYP